MQSQSTNYNLFDSNCVVADMEKDNSCNVLSKVQFKVILTIKLILKLTCFFQSHGAEILASQCYSSDTTTIEDFKKKGTHDKGWQRYFSTLRDKGYFKVRKKSSS